MHKFLPAILVFFICACSADQNSAEEIDIEKEMNELSEDILGPVWTVRTDSQFFEIELPTHMVPSEKTLNPNASLQYRFINVTDTATHEHFVIALIEDLPDETVDSVDLVGFTEAYIDSLMLGREYEIQNNPAIERVNEMDAIIHEFTSSLFTQDGDEIGLYYMFGVFKGQRAVYQVLTWTLLDQRDLFRSDMKHMMYSFKEISAHAG